MENARGKLERKNLDYIVANDITAQDTGFASADNKVTIISKEGKEISLDTMSKRKVAERIFDIIFSFSFPVPRFLPCLCPAPAQRLHGAAAGEERGDRGVADGGFV